MTSRPIMLCTSPLNEFNLDRSIWFVIMCVRICFPISPHPSASHWSLDPRRLWDLIGTRGRAANALGCWVGAEQHAGAVAPGASGCIQGEIWHISRLLTKDFALVACVSRVSQRRWLDVLKAFFHELLLHCLGSVDGAVKRKFLHCPCNWHRC